MATTINNDTTTNDTADAIDNAIGAKPAAKPKVVKQPLPGPTGTKNAPKATTAKAASTSADAKAKREAELAAKKADLEAAKADKEKLAQQKAEERVRKADEAEARKQEREEAKRLKDLEPKVGDIAAEISQELTVRTDTFTPSVIAQTMRDTNQFLISSINSSIGTIDDQQLLDTYAATTDNETASWITRTRLAAEIYTRTKAKVAAKMTAGDIKKSDAATSKSIAETCKAMDIGTSVFMYDVRMWSLIFDGATDAVENIPSIEMVEGAQLLKFRSFFQLAVDCQTPRLLVRELVAVKNKGENLTIKIASQIKDRLNAKAAGREYEEKKVSTVDYLVRVREDQFHKDHEEYICGVFNALNRCKDEGKDIYMGFVDGKLWLGSELPPVSKNGKLGAYTKFGADGTVKPGYVIKSGFEIAFTEKAPATEG
jgi:hypothetical protein